MVMNIAATCNKMTIHHNPHINCPDLLWYLSMLFGGFSILLHQLSDIAKSVLEK